MPQDQRLTDQEAKESFRVTGNEDMENKPAKVARRTRALSVKSGDITDTDEDLEILLVQDKEVSPKKAFGSSLSRSN